MRQYKAAALVSGGLDSLLAAKVIMKQGVHVEGLNFAIGFGGKINPAVAVAEQLGINLHIIDVVDEYKQVVLSPRHGYGSHLNPCLDCKIFMVTKAKEWIEEHGFDFIITGEVIGQRPKSQRIDTMPVVARESGADDLLLRPLCAKNLPLTLPEKDGWIKRELLYGFTGRSRKPQLELVKEFGIKNHPQPAGGCLLAETKFCDRLKDLWQSRGKKDYNKRDLALLKIGRHLRLKKDFKMIIGRNEAENQELEKFCDQYPAILPLSHFGPTVLLDGDADIELAAKIAARFYSKRIVAHDNTVETLHATSLQIRQPNGDCKELTVIPMSPKEIDPAWYV